MKTQNGYGIAALAVTMGVMYHNELSLSSIVLLALLFIFGCRLGTYLLVRERKAAAYRKILYDPSLQQMKPLSVVLMVWLFCAILYVAQVSPVAFRLSNAGQTSDIWAWISAAMVLCGILLEADADAQKSRAKKRVPILIPLFPIYSVVKYKRLQA